MTDDPVFNEEAWPSAGRVRERAAVVAYLRRKVAELEAVRDPYADMAAAALEDAANEIEEGKHRE